MRFRPLLLAALLFFAPRAFAYTGLHYFAGVAGGGAFEPVAVNPYGDRATLGLGAVGLEAGIDSELGWQMVLQGFVLPPLPGLISAQLGGVLQGRYVLFTPTPSLQPYVDLGLGAEGGADLVGRFIAPIVEVGFGIRWRILGIFYIGTEVQWIDLSSGSLAGMAGVEF